MHAEQKNRPRLTPHRLGLPRTLRIRRRSVFRHVQNEGVRVHTPHFLIVQAKGAGPWPRVGITVTKKVGNAVARNRVKRLVREVFRHIRDWFGHVDVVVIAKRGAPELDYERVHAEFSHAKRALQRASRRASDAPEPKR